MCIQLQIFLTIDFGLNLISGFLRSVTHEKCLVQINASDDRSTSMIESKILDVVQMNSVIPDSKPKCLVSLCLQSFGYV